MAFSGRSLRHSCHLLVRHLKLSTSTYQATQSQSTELVQTPSIKEFQETQNKLNPFAKVIYTEQHEYLDKLCPPIKKSFNLAAYVNTSKTLQLLLKLGVSLYDIENTNSYAAQYLLHLDFDKDCVEHIQFLVDKGVKENNLGRFISQFPLIFKEHLDDLQVRINYLESKGFSKRQIARALNVSAIILSLPTKTTDYKLGELQIEFNLPALFLRDMIAKHPDLVTVPCGQYKVVNFTFAEEFGFTVDEIRAVLRAQPNIIEIARPILIERLDLVHNTIGLSHKAIVKFPKLVNGPILEIRHRSQYLRKLGRDQFNPTKPLYVPPSALYEVTDEQFCRLYAKTTIEDFKLFTKSC